MKLKPYLAKNTKERNFPAFSEVLKVNNAILTIIFR
jgi:hypothetical protein